MQNFGERPRFRLVHKLAILGIPRDVVSTDWTCIWSVRTRVFTVRSRPFRGEGFSSQRVSVGHRLERSRSTKIEAPQREDLVERPFASPHRPRSPGSEVSVDVKPRRGRSRSPLKQPSRGRGYSLLRMFCLLRQTRPPRASSLQRRVRLGRGRGADRGESREISGSCRYHARGYADRRETKSSIGDAGRCHSQFCDWSSEWTFPNP